MSESSQNELGGNRLEQFHLRLLEDALAAFEEIDAGQSQDADAAIKRLQERRKLKIAGRTG